MTRTPPESLAKPSHGRKLQKPLPTRVIPVRLDLDAPGKTGSLKPQSPTAAPLIQRVRGNPRFFS
jgi:hypothetical protein